MLAQNIRQRNSEKKTKPFKVKWFYECFGISKQAFYKRLNAIAVTHHNEKIIIDLVKQYRNRVGHKTGGIKLYNELKTSFVDQNIKIGRDKFYGVLKRHNLLIKKTKRYHITTNSNHMFYKYKNLILNSIPTRPEQVWVCDITYIHTEQGHNYLAIITDAYSKKIMGYMLDNHMRVSLCLDALKMALKNRIYPNKALIIHSDRGIQYCNPKYTKFAEENGLQISMTEKYDPYENAIAERINRTLKYEYGLNLKLKNTAIAKKIAKESISIYNNLRTHFSLDLKKPEEVHQKPDVKYKSYRKKNVNLHELTI